MRVGVALLAGVGVLAILLLLAYYGIGGVAAALTLAGWSGLAAITIFHLLPLTLCALAWRTQLAQPPARVWRYVAFRWARDAGGDLLGWVPAGGEIVAIRVMALSGVALNLAAASTVVDLTLEMSAQLAFTLLGLVILALGRPSDVLLGWALAGTGAVLPLLAGLALAQRFGLFRLLERLTQRLAAANGWRGLATAEGIHERIHGIYADRSRLRHAFAIHLAAWLIGAAEAGIALYLMGAPLSIAALLVLESLSYALRSAAFFVPAAVGVQEGGYIVFGSLLGVGPDVMLALSLLKRGRELVLGALGLAIWQAAETRRLWRRARAVGGD